jgi:hypothetical protein
MGVDLGAERGLAVGGVVGGVVTVGIGGVVATGVAAAGTGAAEGWTAVRWAAQPATARAANKKMVMILTGRMATSPNEARPPVGSEQQRGPARSRHGDGRASPQVRNGLDPVAIIDRNEHDHAPLEARRTHRAVTVSA